MDIGLLHALRLGNRLLCQLLQCFQTWVPPSPQTISTGITQRYDPSIEVYIQTGNNVLSSFLNAPSLEHPCHSNAGFLCNEHLWYDVALYDWKYEHSHENNRLMSNQFHHLPLYMLLDFIYYYHNMTIISLRQRDVNFPIHNPQQSSQVVKHPAIYLHQL